MIHCRRVWGRGQLMRSAHLLCVAYLTALGTCARPCSADEPALPSIKVDADQIDFLLGAELVGRYHRAATLAKPYLWPLQAPGGLSVTRGWPMEPPSPGGSTDHPHQKSAWFGHGQLIPADENLTKPVR